MFGTLKVTSLGVICLISKCHLHRSSREKYFAAIHTQLGSFFHPNKIHKTPFTHRYAALKSKNEWTQNKWMNEACMRIIKSTHHKWRQKNVNVWAHFQHLYSIGVYINLILHARLCCFFLFLVSFFKIFLLIDNRIFDLLSIREFRFTL